MNSNRFIYRLKLIFSAVIIWELVFWGLFFLIISSFGLFSEDSGEKLLYKKPKALYGLVALLPILGVYAYHLIKNNQIANRVKPSVAESFLRPVSSMSSFLKYFFFRNAFVFLVIAMAQPVFGSKKTKGTAESLELVVALDVSNSMNVRDISDDLSRLDISKRALIQLINNLHGEKIGLALFANSAFVQLPITRDYGAAKLFISDVESSMISSQGTNIAAALDVSTNMFTKEKVAKGIILITDGENHEVDPADALSKVEEENIQLCVLGIGTSNGGLVPKNPKRPELGYKKNAIGRSVVSRLDEGLIRDVAAGANGIASISSSEFPDLSALLTEIKRMKRSKIDTLEFDVKQERYQIPLFLSLISWILFLLWSKRYVGFLDKLIKR